MQLTHTQAQQVMLAAQGLHKRPAHPATKADVLETIRSMGVLQIDTIHVVARSPYFVLWSRLGDYDPNWLDELLEERQLFEYWSHAACFLPIEDYPLYRRLMLDLASWHSRWWENGNKLFKEHQEVVDHIYTVMGVNGGTRSSDFKREKAEPGGWWNWKNEKILLEYLLIFGEVMISRRDKFQRIYDLRERVLPDWDDTGVPPLEEVYRRFALKTVHALGITRAAWVADYFRTKKQPTGKLIKLLADEGAIMKVDVEGWPDDTYVHPDNLHLIEAATAGRLQPELTTLLSPFDPLVWDRERALAMFDFDYRIECYTPAAKRRYGYFTLPILRRGALIGRLDAKAHRKEKRFEVKALHLEPGITITSELVDDVAWALNDCATWHKTPQVEVVMSDPAEFAALVQRAVTS